MSGLLSDLFSHQSWADAEHWKAFEAFPKALEDEAIRKRLHLYEVVDHIHLVQYAFPAIARKDASFKPASLADFATMAALKQYAMDFRRDIAALVKNISEAQLAEEVTIPWFNNPPLTLSVERALLQAAMHSHYHRGQNATRLRELGGEPPLTDFIVWYWKGQPQPQWT